MKLRSKFEVDTTTHHGLLLIRYVTLNFDILSLYGSIIKTN